MDKEKILRKLKQEIEEVQKKHGVDPLELVGVVRCRDCKHQGTTDCALDTFGYDVIEDGFCSYGERREHDAEV